MSLKSHLQNLTKHSFIYTASTFIQRTLGLIMMPIYTSKAYLASQSDYGDLTLFYTFAAFMNIVYLYGMDSAFMRYFFLGKQDRKDIYKSAFLGVMVNAVILSTLIFVTSVFLSRIIFGSVDYVFHVKLAAVILFLDTFANFPYLILRAEEKSVQYSSIRIVRFISELALNILFVVYLKKGFLGILYANVLASLINVIILLPYQWPYFKGKWNKKAYKNMAT